jgi:hypothetical protein
LLAAGWRCGGAGFCEAYVLRGRSRGIREVLAPRGDKKARPHPGPRRAYGGQAGPPRGRIVGSGLARWRRWILRSVRPDLAKVVGIELDGGLLFPLLEERVRVRTSFFHHFPCLLNYVSCLAWPALHAPDNCGRIKLGPKSSCTSTSTSVSPHFLKWLKGRVFWQRSGSANRAGNLQDENKSTKGVQWPTGLTRMFHSSKRRVRARGLQTRPDGSPSRQAAARQRRNQRQINHKEHKDRREK